MPFAVWPAFAQAPKLEKAHLAIAVGGSISQMNKVAYTMALHRKYFEQEGLTVNSSAFASGTAALQSLIGGSADVAEGAFEHTLRLQTKGVGLTCLATFGRYPGNVLVVKKSQADKIKSVKDLVGKKIGVSAPGASTHNFVAGLMTRAGIDWNKASYLSIGTGPSAVAAMRSGSSPRCTRQPRPGDQLTCRQWRCGHSFRQPHRGRHQGGVRRPLASFLMRQLKTFGIRFR